jgi:hypothetical protein
MGLFDKKENEAPQAEVDDVTGLPTPPAPEPEQKPQAVPPAAPVKKEKSKDPRGDAYKFREASKAANAKP